MLPFLLCQNCSLAFENQTQIVPSEMLTVRTEAVQTPRLGGCPCTLTASQVHFNCSILCLRYWEQPWNSRAWEGNLILCRGAKASSTSFRKRSRIYGQMMALKSGCNSFRWRTSLVTAGLPVLVKKPKPWLIHFHSDQNSKPKPE